MLCLGEESSRVPTVCKIFIEFPKRQKYEINGKPSLFDRYLLYLLDEPLFVIGLIFNMNRLDIEPCFTLRG